MAIPRTKTNEINYGCSICNGPVRDEIDLAIKRGAAMPEVARAYHVAHNKTYDQFYPSLYSHVKKKHPPSVNSALKKVTVSKLPPPPPAPAPGSQIEPLQNQQPVTIENFAQKLLEKGFTSEMMGKVTPNVIIQAQKVLIEKDKLKVQNNALKFAMLKFMSGMADEADEKIIKGEEV